MAQRTTRAGTGKAGVGRARAAGAAAAGAGTAGTGTAASEADPVEVALRLAGQLGWRDLSLADVAAESGMKMSELYPRYRSKAALAAAFIARVDAAMLDQIAAEEPGEPLRDRLFAAIMARFDMLQRHRDGVLAVARDSARDPILALAMAAGPMRRSMDCLLEGVGLSADGWRGIARRKAIGAIYLAAFRAWSRDDSEDLGRTMAALDRLLARWLPAMERLDRRGRRFTGEAGAAGAQPG